MASNKIDIIRVNLARLNDWVVATSKELEGLYLANPSYDTVYKQIPEAIRLLYKAKDNVDVKVEPAPHDNEKISTSEVAYIAKAA